MNTLINAKQLRASLPKLVECVRKGACFTVFYRSHPEFQIVPVDETAAPRPPLEADTLYHAKPVGGSTAGRAAADHDDLLDGR